MADRYRDDYSSRPRGSSGRPSYDSDRTVEGLGYGGRNWAERTGDEVASWVGDSDAEARRERDRQTIGRYPGEDRGERYGSRMGSTGYGDHRNQSAGYRGYDGDRTVQGSGYGGRNWAERGGDEVASWVGDRDAEARRERDRQTIGRYPGEDRGERGYGASSSNSHRHGRDRHGRDRYGSDRTVEGSGYAGRNWAERTGDEVASWVGDSDAEQRRERDRQTIGRYPGEDRGERAFGASSDRSGRYAGGSFGAGSYGSGTSGGTYGAGTYGAGTSGGGSGAGGYGSSRYSEGQGYGGRATPTERDRSDDSRRYSEDRGRDNWAGGDYNADDRGFFTKAGDEVMSWFGDRDAERRRELDTMRSEAEGAYGGSSSSTGLGAATGYSASSFGHDPDYAAYRKARTDEYDRDYHEYKSGKASEFEKDFSTFRTSRTKPAMGGAGEGIAGQIREHAKVVGSDGQHVGEVDRVAGSDIKLAKKDSPDGKHHLISVSKVASVDGDTVKLSCTAAEAKREWRDGESAAPGSAHAGTASAETAKAY